MAWMHPNFRFHGQNCGNTPEAMRDFLDAMFIMVRLGFRVIPGYGTLLGLYRDGKLIDHDKDVDVSCICREPGDAAENDIISAFEKQGFIVIKKDMPSQLCFTRHNDLVIDVNFLYWDGGPDKYYQPHEMGKFSFTAEQLAEPEKYLKAFYGDDWIIPKKKNFREGEAIKSSG